MHGIDRPCQDWRAFALIKRSQTVQRPTKCIDDAPEQGLAVGQPARSIFSAAPGMVRAQQLGGDDRILDWHDLRAGPQSDCFGQWHQKQTVIREADHFRIDRRRAFGRNHAN